MLNVKSCRVMCYVDRYISVDILISAFLLGGAVQIQRYDFEKLTI